MIMSVHIIAVLMTHHVNPKINYLRLGNFRILYIGLLFYSYRKKQIQSGDKIRQNEDLTSFETSSTTQQLRTVVTELKWLMVQLSGEVCFVNQRQRPTFNTSFLSFHCFGCGRIREYDDNYVLYLL